LDFAAVKTNKTLKMSGDFAHPLFEQLCTTGFILYEDYERKIILAQTKTLAEAKQTALDLMENAGKKAILIYEF
jgi:hypothetical protein